MTLSALWYLSFKFFFITRAASASVINKNENDKYHNAREFIVLTRLSHEISFFTAQNHTQNHAKPQECNTVYISTLQTIESSAKKLISCDNKQLTHVSALSKHKCIVLIVHYIS